MNIRWLVLSLIVFVLVVCSSVLKKLVMVGYGGKFSGMVVQGRGVCLVYCFEGLLYVVVKEDLNMCGNYIVGGLYKFGVCDSILDYIFNVVCIFELEVIVEECLVIGNKLFYVVLGKLYKVFDDICNYVECGMVLYYGVKFYGCLIFNCEVYDMYQFIVVYKILLLFSFVCVINLDNGELVIVCVNDCGLFYDGCVVDFSYVVVVCLGIIQCGIGNVEVCVLQLGESNLLVQKLLCCECCVVEIVVVVVGVCLVLVMCVIVDSDIDCLVKCLLVDVMFVCGQLVIIQGVVSVVLDVVVSSLLLSVLLVCSIFVVLVVVVSVVLCVVVLVVVCMVFVIVVVFSLLQQVVGVVMVQVVSFFSCDNVNCVMGQFNVVGIVGVIISDIVVGGCILFCLCVFVSDYVSVVEFVGCIVGLGLGLLQIVKD